MNIEERISTIAEALSSDGYEEISLADWKAFCIVHRIGYDVRTQRSVLNLAITLGMLKAKKTTKTPIYLVDHSKVKKLRE